MATELNTMPPTTPTNTQPSTAATMNPQTKCPVLKLSRELREMIYVYVFAPDLPEKVTDKQEAEPDRSIPLNTASKIAPPVDLALTCRALHQESIATHQAAYAAFWAKNTFTIDDILAKKPDAITRKHVEHMTHIVFDLTSTHLSGHAYLRAPPKKEGGFPWDVTMDGAIAYFSLMNGFVEHWCAGRKRDGRPLGGADVKMETFVVVWQVLEMDVDEYGWFN